MTISLVFDPLSLHRRTRTARRTQWRLAAAATVLSMLAGHGAAATEGRPEGAAEVLPTESEPPVAQPQTGSQVPAAEPQAGLQAPAIQFASQPTGPLAVSPVTPAAVPGTSPPPVVSRIGDLSGWLTVGTTWGIVVDPVVRPQSGAHPKSLSATANGPGFFVGLLPGRERVAGGVLVGYRPPAAFPGGGVGLWYFDLQGHLLPNPRFPLSIFAAVHMGELSWNVDAPSPGYSGSEFTAGFATGLRFAIVRHIALVAEYRATGLFDGTMSTVCNSNGQCSESNESNTKFMHIFSAGLSWSAL